MIYFNLKVLVKNYILYLRLVIIQNKVQLIKNMNICKTKKILGVIVFFLLTNCTDINFDSNKWKNWDITESDSNLRWDMVDDLINNNNLIGKTNHEIIQLLGNPDNGFNNSSELFYYDLGPCRRGIDFADLEILFKNGKVIKVEKFCH